MSTRSKTTFRITMRGAVYSVLTVAVGIAAILKGNNLLFVIFATLLAILFASAFFTWLMPGRILLRRVVPDTATAEEAFRYTLRIFNRSRFWPVVFLRIQDRISHEGRTSPISPTPVMLPIARRGERVKAFPSAVPQQRGWAKLGPFHVTSEFPPGLFSCTRTTPVDDKILIYPRPALLRRRVVNPLISQMDFFNLSPALYSSGDEEFAGLREYRPGDNPRRIHWKMSGRIRNRILIKEYEDTRVRNAVILLETFLPNLSDLRRRLRLERAISFTVALTELLHSENYLVNFRTYGPDLVNLTLEPAKGSVEELLHRLALLKPSRIHSLQELIDRETGDQDEVYFLLQISPGEAPDWRLGHRTVSINSSDMRSMMIPKVGDMV